MAEFTTRKFPFLAMQDTITVKRFYKVCENEEKIWQFAKKIVPLQR